MRTENFYQTGSNRELKSTSIARAVARQKALSELARKYPDEYKQLHDGWKHSGLSSPAKRSRTLSDLQKAHNSEFDKLYKEWKIKLMANERVTETDILRRMQGEVGEWCEAKGWANDDRTFGDDIALLHSELSEALEAYRDMGLLRRANYQDTNGELSFFLDKESTNPETMYGTGKPEGVASELADVLVRLLDTCHRYEIDLFSEWRAKMNYNWTRAYRHGGRIL